MNIKSLIKPILIVLSIFIIMVICYAMYVIFSYKRLPDNQVIEPENTSNEIVKVEEPYKILTFNVGYGSYPPDYTFFMEGGSESIGRSAKDVRKNINGVISIVQDRNPDLLLLQEVDINGTRSHHINQYEMFFNAFVGYSSFFSLNYDSSFLAYPIFNPIGKNKSSISLLSRFNIGESTRVSLPIAKGFSSLVDLDRCYTVSKLKVDNGKNLYLYNVHFSAYGADESIKKAQVQKLSADIAEKMVGGNYIICGGDFNATVLKGSFEAFNPGKEVPNFAVPFPTELLPKEISLVTIYDEISPVATSRTLDVPYGEESTLLIIDGFIVSDNVMVKRLSNIDAGFIFSDHNPVEMMFSLNE